MKRNQSDHAAVRSTRPIETMAATRYAVYISLFYNVVGMLPFLMSDTVKDLIPGIKTEDCPRRNQCKEHVEFTSAKIYLQVIVGVAVMFACLIGIDDRKNGLLAALGCFICTMAKHIIVDDLIPPPPVMAMTAITLAAVAFGPGEWGKRVFVGFNLINAFTFITQPLMVVNDTFPTIVAGSDALKNCTWFLEVIALYSVMAAIYAATPNRALGLAYSYMAIFPVLGKHVILDKAGPPAFMIVLNFVGAAVAWYEVGWADLKPACDKAIKSGPMKLHAIIVAAGFVPYFIVESIGLSIPMLGMAAIDSSYAYTGATALLCGFTAIFCSIVAYIEYTGQMEGKLFAVYHYFLSVVVSYWMLQPSTSDMGKLFFTPPLLFTAWTIYIVNTKDPKAD